jgi:molybdopterin/thiamine biosynthesis adenylyltransferase/rhodanese-related sulfurtransferase
VAFSANERARYRRHLSLPEIGPAGQQRLKDTRVLVVGMGGLGCPSALYLAAAGIGTLGLVDFDRVELSNLQRQVLFGSEDLGRLKVQVARERLLALNPEIEVLPHALMLRAQNVCEVVEDYDIVLDGSDRLSTRYLVNDACVLRGRPLVTAAIHRFEGQAMTYIPGLGPCYRCLFPQVEQGAVAGCADAGVLGVLPGVLGALQASEAIKIAAGIGAPLTGRLLSFDALALSFTELPVSRRADCPVCGEHPHIAAPRDIGPECDRETLAARRFSAIGLRDLLASAHAAGPPLVLIDVREPREFAARHLEGARNIPLRELESRLGELAGDGDPVFLCRSGRRSLLACAIALRAGIAAPGHLEGGLLAWAADVDADFEVASD